MDTNKLSDVDGKENTKRRKQPDRKASKGKIRKNEIMDYNPLTKTGGAGEDNMNRLEQPIPGELLKGDEIMDCSKPSTQTEGAGEENMSTSNQLIQGEMLEGNIVLEKNKSMDSNKISTKTEEAHKENMNRFKKPIQGESLKGNILGEKSEIVDSNNLSKIAVGDDEVNVIRSLKQPMQGESLEGCPIILLRNIDPPNGLCNGTRLICRAFQRNVIDVEIAVGEHAGKRVFLPRIPLCPSDDNMFPFKLKRKQFPVRLSFAMTINKAQGQTISNVGVYLPQSVFAHGQLYVALSRGISRTNTKVLVKPVKDFNQPGSYTSNVVYREVLQDV